MATAPKKILCIEDDQKSAALIAEELVDLGFEVSIARNGQEGFVAILKDKPDLVLCDIGVPIMSGFEALERLSAIEPRFGHTPIVLLTALADRDNELKGRRLGADDYVTKPIDFDVLATIINARLAGVARTKLRPKLVKLNDREIQALTWVARGKTSAEIARKLDLVKPRYCAAGPRLQGRPMGTVRLLHHVKFEASLKIFPSKSHHDASLKTNQAEHGSQVKKNDVELLLRHGDRRLSKGRVDFKAG
jgi:CheY-like chemotaxis protein